jgi:regulator of protease activity HflC (stomatin/prohibitin superfamily)
VSILLIQQVAGIVTFVVVFAVALFIIFLLGSTVRIVKEYERGVIFRLGRVQGRAKGPGLIFLVPIVDKMVKVQLRTVSTAVPPQEVITRDNVPAKVDAVIYFRVMDPNRSVLEVEDYILATSQISQTTLRSVLGNKDLDDLLTNRETINEELQVIIDGHTEPWGVKVSAVEVKDVVIPQTMQRSMAGQAEAERERRAKIIAAEGEYQASERLSQAADRLASPTSLQLRLFQTLSEIASEKNSTIILPVPIDLFEPYLRVHSDNTSSTHSGNGSSKDNGSSKASRVRIGEEEETTAQSSSDGQSVQEKPGPSGVNSPIISTSVEEGTPPSEEEPPTTSSKDVALS